MGFKWVWGGLCPFYYPKRAKQDPSGVPSRMAVPLNALNLPAERLVRDAARAIASPDRFCAFWRPAGRHGEHPRSHPFPCDG